MFDDARCIEIETKLAFQEDALRQLHEALCGQQQRIERLELTCEMLAQRLKELPLDSGVSASAVEIPPHY